MWIVLASVMVESVCDEKYPGLCLSWPEVFKKPHDSLGDAISRPEVLSRTRDYSEETGAKLPKENRWLR